MSALNAFLHKVLVSRHVQQTVMDVQVGVSREGLSVAKLGQFLIPLPPLAEQSRIVTRVDELMRLCDALEAKGQLEAAQHAQLVQTLLGALTASTTPDELAHNWQSVATHFDLLLDRPEAVDALEQTILQLAVRGLLVPHDPNDEPASVLLQRIYANEYGATVSTKNRSRKLLKDVASDEILFETPIGWSWVRVESIAEVIGGIQKTQLRRPVQQHYPYLRVANVQRDVLQLDEIERFELTTDELAKWRLLAGDLLIVEGNGSANEIGRCAVWDGSIDPCVYQNHLIRVRCHEPALVAFIKLFLNSPSGAQEMKRLAITSSGLFSLSVGKIRNYVVPLPPLAEQSRIVSRVESLRRLCADLRQRLAARQTTQAHLAEALVSSVSH
jgi:type I restriction enzyme S subunit